MVKNKLKCVRKFQKTEQEDNDEEDLPEENNNYFSGKNKETKCNKTSPSQRVRSKSHNIIKKLPGVIGAAKAAQTPLECWSCLMTDDILNIIVQYTNQYIETVKESFQRESDARTIDIIELKAFLGLLFLEGVHRSKA